jgi:hypothetical protein
LSGRLGCNLQGLEVGGLVCRLCEALDLHVSILRLPIVVLLHENGADEPHRPGDRAGLRFAKLQLSLSAS